MSNVKHYLKCDNCGGLIEASSIKLENQIVSKDALVEIDCRGLKSVAVRYYFNCPHCWHEYTCFYKDHITNELFRANKDEEAKERMIMLWELFENGC